MGLRLRRILGIWFFLLLLGGAGGGGYAWWRHAQIFVSTDDAYVHAPVAPVSPRIAGMVSEVLVRDNQPVRKGDILVRLDKKRHQVAVEKAEAALAVALSKYESAKLSVPYTEGRTSAMLDAAYAKLATLRQTFLSAKSLLIQRKNETLAAAANLQRAGDELSRKKRLHRQGIISNGEMEKAISEYKFMEANFKAAQAAEQAEGEKTAALKQQLKEIEANIALAKTEKHSTNMRAFDSKSLESEAKQVLAELKERRLLLSYTDIRAPITGYVSKNTAEPGTFVQPGRMLMALVPLEKVYILANFTEKQLENIRVGQNVEISADAYPNMQYRGHVDSIDSGTGDAFSLLPPQNATGNWVKVTRRIPVKIVLDEAPPPNAPLRVGLSMTVTVDTRDKSGPKLVAFPARNGKNMTAKK